MPIPPNTTLPCVSVRADGVVILEVLAAPRSSANRILGVHDGRLKVAVTAPPVDGQANTLITEFIAEILELPRRSVILIGGETSRRKRLALQGAALEQTMALLSARLGR